MSTKAQIGTLSHGTMRTEDLIPTFADELERLDTDGEHAELIAEANAVEDYDDEPADDILIDLFDALDAFAPPYCYFGANEGDGSDYGFWPSLDAIDNDERDGGLVKVSDLSEIPAGWRGMVALVNDHGNLTIYEPITEWRECWAIV